MNILHLSDIHFGRNYPEYGLEDPFEKHDEIVDGIIEKLEKMDDALKPEHIIFTGDIAWHGKKKEFDEALEWFQRLLKACHLTGKDISFCAGNHDIDLSCQFDDMHYDANMISEIDELYQYDNVKKLEDCLYAYNNFCRQIGTIPYTYPSDGKRKYSYSMGYKDIPFSNGKTMRIVAMNTSLLMTQGFPDDKMWLGREQLKSLIHYGVLPPDKDIWYTVCLFHHSERFLHPNETSTYDGRNATLPSLMEYTNLLACGHTESSGRPRLSKQPGGGTMLLGGAAYYNDEHVNSFSMLYVSDKKKSMGYIPYIYEGSWQDYDFCSVDFEAGNTKALEEKPELHQNIALVVESDNEQYVIPFDYLEFHHQGGQISSNMDLVNHFHLEYDSRLNGNAVLSCSEGQKHYAKTQWAYLDFLRFMNKHKDNTPKAYLRNQEGEVIKCFQGVCFEEIPIVDESFLKDILFIEEYYDVNFTLPASVDEKDYAKINILKSIAANGYTDKVKVAKSLRLKKNYQEMTNLYDAALSKNDFGVYGEDYFSIRLFNINVMLGKVWLCMGPFSLDIHDTKYKLDTYQKYGERYCLFTGSNDIGAYIVKDRERAERTLRNQPFAHLIDDYGDQVFQLDI